LKKNSLILNWEDACEFVNNYGQYIELFCVEEKHYFLNARNQDSWKNHNHELEPNPIECTFEVNKKYLISDNKLNRKLYPNNKVIQGYILKEIE